MTKMVSVLNRSQKLVCELRQILPKVEFHEVKDPENDENLQNSQIVIADFDYIAPYLYKLPNLKWLQGTWAGVDALKSHIKDEKPNFMISRFSGEHFGRIMGEYVVSNIVNFERNAFDLRKKQEKQYWDNSVYQDGNCYRVIYDLTIGILGLGSIGARVAKILHSLGATIHGYGRRKNLQNELPILSNYYTKEKLPQFLQSCDYIVNILPNTEESIGLLNGAVLENCKEKGAVFVNIGRGSIIREMDLINALERKWLKGAILDVFEKEPLCSESPLWKMPQVILTPHISGCSRPKDIAEQFKTNLELYEKGLQIPNLLDFEKGY